MPFMSNEQSEQPGTLLANDHSKIDTLIVDVLSALEEGDKSKAFARLDLLWARLAVHIRAEHLCLFPSILEANSWVSGADPKYQESKSALDQLRLDHEFFMHELGTAVNAMRSLEIAFDQEVVELRDVRDRVAKVQSRLDQHNRLEEDHVYRWVNILLGSQERAALTARIKYELENLPQRVKPDSR